MRRDPGLERPADWGVPISPPPAERYLRAFNAETRRILGLPAAPDLSELPAGVADFVRRM